VQVYFWRIQPVKPFKLLLFLAILLAFHAPAEIYKWVDDEGVTHYEDCPPRDCAFEEFRLQEGPSEEEIEAANAKLREMLEARKARDEAEKLQRERVTREKQVKQQARAERSETCAQAIYQLDLLNQQRRVFKILNDGTRQYLNDSDRPDEISRISVIREEFCSDDESYRREEIQRAKELSIALSRRCYAAREKLEQMLLLEAKPDDETLKEYQVFVEAFCPAVECKDCWLGDWIIAGRRK
jgi:hypothetical protein